MGMVMVRCPQTGHAIPTGIKADRESFGRRPVFFSRTHCPICRTDHAWFAREAWVDEPEHPRAASQRGQPGVIIDTDQVMTAMDGHHDTHADLR